MPEQLGLLDIGHSGPLIVPDYRAPAVHFDGNTFFQNSSLVCTDNSFFSAFFWFKTSSNFTMILCINDPLGHYSNRIQIGSGRSWDFQGNNPDDTVTYTAKYPNSTFGNPNHWYSVLFTVDTNQPVNQKIWAAYIDDVKVDPSLITDGGGAFSMVNNGFLQRVGSDGPETSGFGVVGDVSTLWIAPGVSLLSGTDIPSATRRLFTTANNKPLNPNSFPSAAMIFDGNAASWGNNRGTGGGFALVSGALTDASSSPSD